MILTTTNVTGFAICHDCIPNYNGKDEPRAILCTEEEALQRNPGIRDYVCCIRDHKKERSEACEFRRGRIFKGRYHHD